MLNYIYYILYIYFNVKARGIYFFWECLVQEEVYYFERCTQMKGDDYYLIFNT